MFDFHYDLLTQLYISYLNQDFNEVKKFCQSFREENVKAVIANLCFETEEEMKLEYHKNYWDPNVGIKEMFQIAISLVSKFVAPEISVYYSIEGCDFVEIEDLEELYQMGLRSILPVWNHANQYGSGSRTKLGLTEKGRLLIQKAVELGIAIDLSHMNQKTFFDTLNEIERLQKVGKKVIFFASHSNVRTICDRERNLTDEQLLRLHQLGGKVGIFSNRNFVIEKALSKNIGIEELKTAYLNHIIYTDQLLGGIDSIVLSTDDMGWDAAFANDPDFSLLAIYSYPTIQKEICKTLGNYYTEEQIEKMLYKNGVQLFIEKRGKEK